MVFRPLAAGGQSLPHIFIACGRPNHDRCPFQRVGKGESSMAPNRQRGENEGST